MQERRETVGQFIHIGVGVTKKNMKVTQDDFVQVLVDCRGESREEAIGLSKEYRNDLGAYILDIGGDEQSIAEAKSFLSL